MQTECRKSNSGRRGCREGWGGEWEGKIGDRVGVIERAHTEPAERSPRGRKEGREGIEEGRE